ncbi:MAG TPA: hypothetical protein VFC53_03215 [Dehalococcoidia bacterium]|nr:hypothetical protein [Dehalococcoidia bacterium]
MRTPAKASILLVLGIFALICSGCLVVIPYASQPAAGYVAGSGQPLRVAVLDETWGDDWRPALERSVAAYAEAMPWLQFQSDPAGANIVIRVFRYRDEAPPALPGYVFQPGVGGFAAVYDTQGAACNFPPAPAPVNCSGEIATAAVYLNDIIPPGPDIEARRDRLIRHELGHALGLTRHSPDLDVADLARRYGWPQ